MTRDDQILLTGIYMFEGFPVEGLRLLWEASDQRRLRAGEVLFQQGQLADCGYLVLSGSILLSTTPFTQDEVVSTGGFIGEMALLIEQRRGATAISRAETRVLRVSASAYKKIAKMFPEAAHKAGLEMQFRLDQMMQKIDAVRQQLVDIDA
jgi:CRP-like cAMP-binding protein